MQLENAVALVTGAGSGIGRAIAVEAARRGMRVVLVGRRVKPLFATRNALDGAPCLLQPADITSAADRARLADAVAERFGALDLLVNNAGLVHTGAVAACDDAALERLLATNVTAPIALVRDLLPLLRRSAGARVLNVGSMFGDVGFPYFVAYSATKFALRGFSDALRRELAGDGIGVTYAAPRATRTPAADGFAHLVGPMRMTLDPPERVARQLLEGVRRDARSVYPRGPERLFVLLARLAPRLIDRNLGMLAARTDVRDAVAGGAPCGAPADALPADAQGSAGA